MKKTAAVTMLAVAVTVAVSGCAETAADRAAEACEATPDGHTFARDYLGCED